MVRSPLASIVQAFLTFCSDTTWIWQTYLGYTSGQPPRNDIGIYLHFGHGPIYSNTIQDLTICVILLIITTGLTKISILLFYLRIFPHQTFRRVCYALVGFVTAWTITFTFVQIFQCNPIHKAWDHTVPGTCANNGIITFAQAILSVFQDIFIIILPLPLFLRLKVSRQKKWGVVLMFGLGIM